MDELLTQVSHVYRRQTADEEFLIEPESTKPVSDPKPEFRGSWPEEALEALKSQPDYDTLLSVLQYLQRGARGKHTFNILKPSPQSAQLVHVLVTEIVPNYWTVLKDASADRSKSGDVDLLLGCLSSISGLNAVLAFLRALLQEVKTNPKEAKQSHAVFTMAFILDLLSDILQSANAVKKLWTSVMSSENNSTKLRGLRQELLALLGSGKIVSLVAEVEATLQQAEKLERRLWIADSKQYVEWLGRNLVSWLKSDISEDEVKLCADLLARGLKLGHAELIVKILLTSLLLHDDQQHIFTKLLNSSSQSDQKKLLFMVLKLLSSKFLDSIDFDGSTEDYPLIWAVAAALKIAAGASEARRSHLVSWLTDASGAGIGEGCGIRRAAMAVLAENKEALFTVLEKSLAQFGDHLYIKHAPILQQEAHAQVLLLSAGYVHRLSPIKLTLVLRSSAYLNAISNRIGASQNRARFLGMVVGEALSGLVDGKEKKLDFHMEDTNTDDGKWYKSLVNISDKIGPINPLQSQDTPEQTKPTTATPKKTEKPKPQPPRSAPKPGFIIEEIEDDENENDEDDLVPHAKPDSDAEDSDDDPTLVNRNKPKAPVYIRDLIAYLRDTESYDRQKLAVTTAPTLIRRKANYGTEVSSHAQELSSLLVGLQDHFGLPDFHSLHLQGMVALIVAQPQKMGPWFAKTFFDGDYSLSQRASILVALGLSGREIGGFETSEYATAAAFPSKQLPAKAEKFYALLNPPNSLTSSASRLKALPANAIETISQKLSQTFLAPLAAEAADAATGPDALKLSSFTSRLQQQQTKTATSTPNKPRGIRPTKPNTSASLISTSLLAPLTSRFQAALHASTHRSVLFHPELLSLYLKTLSLLFHAAGPSAALSQPHLTSEFWHLVLGVRPQCVGDLGVTHAVLFGLMALLDVNADDMRGVCERQGREVVESMEWASGVFDGTMGDCGDGMGEENQVKMMAAGVLIRLREAVQRYRALLMGELIGVA